MPELRAIPGQVIQVGPLGSELETDQLVRLIRTNDLEVLQLMVPAGRTVPTHLFPGEIIVHCLQGRVSLMSLGEGYPLGAGQLLHYSSYEPFSVRGIEDSSLLITVALPKEGEASELIG